MSAYLAGHCHAMQHAILENTHFIITGTGSKYEDACSPRIGWAADNQLGFVQVLVGHDNFQVLFWKEDLTILRSVNGLPRILKS